MGRTADAIAEGVAIATAAARLAVKNHILIGTIAENGVFDTDKYVADAREALRAMAEEAEEAAETSPRSASAPGAPLRPHGTHDYRDRDVRNLRRRAKQSHGVAANDCASMMQDPEAARRDRRGGARGRVGRRAPQPRPSAARRGHASRSGPGLRRMREARMQALRLVDLQALSSEQRAKAKRRKKQEGRREDED